MRCANAFEVEWHIYDGIFADVDPYAKPNERKVGGQRPQISHISREIDKRTLRQRQAEKQAVAAERRAIKKAARRDLKKQMLDELKEYCDEKSEIRTRASGSRAGRR